MRLVDALQLTRVVVDAEQRTVDVDVEAYWCDASKPEHHSWTFSQLEAKLENTSAFALHANKDYKSAALGFARAAAADPTWRIPAYNLASAHTLLGNQDAAIKALSPWLTSEPIATFVHVTSDPELSPLLGRPELAAVRAARPGAVKLGVTGIDGEVGARLARGHAQGAELGCMRFPDRARAPQRRDRGADRRGARDHVVGDTFM